jgi:hypothetical protein
MGAREVGPYRVGAARPTDGVVALTGVVGVVAGVVAGTPGMDAHPVTRYRAETAHLTVLEGEQAAPAELTARRLPPPWTVEEQSACFVVRDHNCQQLAYVYFEDEPGRRSAAKLLSKDEALRIAANITKLPELLRPL